MSLIAEPYVIRHLIGQRYAQKEMAELYDLRPMHLELLSIIYALNENSGFSDCIRIAEIMGGHPKNLLYKPLRELKADGYIEIMKPTTKKKKRGFNPDLYTIHQKGVDILVQYVNLIKKHGAGF